MQKWYLVVIIQQYLIFIKHVIVGNLVFTGALLSLSLSLSLSLFPSLFLPQMKLKEPYHMVEVHWTDLYPVESSSFCHRRDENWSMSKIWLADLSLKVKNTSYLGTPMMTINLCRYTLDNSISGIWVPYFAHVQCIQVVSLGLLSY